MKKLLLMAFAIAAIVSCQKHVEGPGPQKPFEPATPDKSAPIFLSVGSGAATRAGGIGIRNTKFEKGDVIGVFAAHVKWTTPSTYEPDWLNPLYFANIPASYSATGTTADTVAFTWGLADKVGDLAISQFYPAKDRSIYVYAYYPYTKNITDSIKFDATTKIPSRFIDLVEGQILPADAEGGDPKKNVNLIQPDYMWAVGRSEGQGASDPKTHLDTVRRTVRLDTLTFKHALAQLNFRLYLMDDNAKACKFDSLIITVPKKGSYDLVTGLPSIFSSTETVKPKTDSVTYIITTKKGEELPAAISADDKSNALDLLTTSPLMVFPMTVEQLKGCQIRIVIDYGLDGAVSSKSYYVKMDQTGLKAVKQGFYNSIYMGVGQTEVAIKCNITPWGINKPEDDSNLDVE